MRLSPQVRTVLEAARVEGNRLFLTGQLDRKLYLEVAKAIEAMGGKWSKKERAHLFEDAATEVVADAVATGACVDLKKEFQFFETPPAVAKQLVDLAEPVSWERILEPSAGRGRIVEALKDEIDSTIFCCELNERHHAALRSLGAEIIGADFLALNGGLRFDRIVANPPFTKGQDITHVYHMWELLRDGGRLVSVMSPGWRFRQNNLHATFRRWVEKDIVGEWIDLPAGSFSASGTEVNAGILILDKPREVSHA